MRKLLGYSKNNNKIILKLILFVHYQIMIKMKIMPLNVILYFYINNFSGYKDRSSKQLY